MTWLESNYPDSTIDDWDQATIDEADAYHEARGNALWTGADSVKTIALQRSWDYLRGLSWKEDVFDTELPDDIKNAQIEGALVELTDPGNLLPENNSDNKLKMKDIAGVIVKEWFPGASSRTQYRTISNLLSKYLIGGPGQIPLVRG